MSLFDRVTRKDRAFEADPGYRLADELPYLTAIEPENPDDLDEPWIFVLKDGGLGAAWWLGMPAAESSINASEILADSMDNIIRAIPIGWYLQVETGRSPNVRRYLARYAKATGDDPFAALFAQGTMERWAKAQYEGFFPGEDKINFYPRAQNLGIFLRTPPMGWLSTKPLHQLRDTLSAFLGRTHATSVRDLWLRRMGQFREASRAMSRHIESSGFNSFLMTPDDLIAYIEESFFPERNLYTRPLAWQRWGALGEPLDECIGRLAEVDYVDGARVITRYGGRSTIHRALSMIWQPDAVADGMLDSLFSQVQGNIQCSFGFRMLDHQKTVIGLKVGSYMASKMNTPWTEVETVEKTKSLKEAQRRAFSGERIVKARLNVLIQTDQERVSQDRTAEAKTLMSKMFEVDEETTIGASIWRECLPMARNGQNDLIMARDRRMMSRDIAGMIPISGSWEGPLIPPSEISPDFPYILYANRWGAPLCIDTSRCETNPHFLVTGSSGSGKSFFIHDLAKQLWRMRNVRMYLISIKPDYRKLARLLGKYVDIDLDHPVSINPFSGPPTLDNQAFWTAILVRMIIEDDPMERVDKQHRNILSDCVMTAAQANWDATANQPIRETLLDDIVQVLQEHSEIGTQLAYLLTPYHTGPYSKLFNRPIGIQDTDRFIFFNLSGVKEMSCKGPVLLSLFRFINNIMYREDMRGIPKFLGLDEVWSLLDDAESAGFLSRAVRAYRSLGGYFFAISQMLTDFDTPMGSAILNNTSTKIVLKQLPDELNKLPNYLTLNERERQLIASLQIIKRKFSEFFIKMEGMPSTVGRLVPDAATYAIATTDAKDEAIYNRLLAECNQDPHAALDRFMHQFPFGQAISS